MTRFALCATALTLASAGVLAQAPNGGGPGPVLGIVEIPKVFSIDPQTGQRVAGALTLYVRPDSNSRQMATISSPEAIDDAEYGYEEPGALVYGRQGSYYLIRTARGTGWLAPDDAGRFHPFQELISKDLTYLTDAWDGFVSASPGAASRIRVPRQKTYGDEDVKVSGFRTVAGKLWLQVEVLTHSICESETTPAVRARGWVPAHDASGAPTVWFPSRGC